MRVSRERITKGLWWDEAWSLVSGCSKCSPGCQNCWLESFTARMSLNPNQGIAARYAGLTRAGEWEADAVRFNEPDLFKPFSKRKPTTYAIWSDLFHEALADEVIAYAMAIMLVNPRHTFIACTKRPDRMLDFFMKYNHRECIDLTVDAFGLPFIRKCGVLPKRINPWPLPNLVGMVSMENQAIADERLPFLIRTPLICRAIAAAPLLGDISIKSALESGSIHWVVAECEKMPGGRPGRHAPLEWFARLMLQAASAGIPFFMKQAEVSGKVVPLPVMNGRRWCELPTLRK